MVRSPNAWLIVGGVLSLIAAALHVAIIFGGPSWYRFFGAGEGVARAAAKGLPMPTIMAIAIAAVLAIWAGYAFSGAGLIGKLPLLRLGLIVISAIYLLRGLALFGMLAFTPARVDAFWVWSSLIVLVYGLAYAVGTWTAWPSLSNTNI